MAIDQNADFTPSIPDSGVVPTKIPYNPTGSFKFWAQKVIPLVYDDSLSYYEVLCKVVTYLNNVIHNVDNLNDSIDSTNESFETLKSYVNTTKNTLINTYNELQEYVNTYFDNLDVQTEIDKKLDAMADSGELTALLSPFVPDIVTSWLNNHVNPVGSAVIVDNTLSISGAAADAKETGDRINGLISGNVPVPLIKDVYITPTGEETHYSSWSASDYMQTYGANVLTVTSPLNNNGNFDAFYDSEKVFIASFQLRAGENIINVPENAVYFRLSNTTTSMNGTVVKWWMASEVNNIIRQISTLPFVSNNDQCNRFFKELFIEGADPNTKYKWYFASNNNENYWYNVGLAIDGTSTIVAYLTSQRDKPTNPVLIPEYNNSGIKAYAILDWDALESGSNKTYNIPLNDSVKDIFNSPSIYSFLNKNENILIAMPERINAVVGDTLQLYYQGMFRCVNSYNYAVTLQCDIGAQYPRYYELTPTASNIGEHTLTVQLRDNNGSIISNKNVIINVVATPTSPATQKNVFCIGASCTQNGEWAGEVKRKLTQDYNLTNVNFIGRMAVNGTRLEATGGYTWMSYTNPNATLLYKFYFNSANLPSVVNVGDVYSNNGHNYTITEINIPTPDGGGYISCTSDGLPGGASGTLTRVSGTGDNTLTYYNYVTSGNPFVYNGQINIPQYMTEYCDGVSPDIVYTELFVNGSSPYNNNVSSMMGNMKAFVQMFHDAYPNCKIALGMPYCPDEKGGTGRNYNASGGFSWEYGIKYTFMEYMKEIENYLSDNDLSDYVSIVDWTNEFDSENDFWQTTKAVNVRSTQTEVFGVNGIHPSNVGYMQMADSVVRHFIANFCQ